VKQAKKPMKKTQRATNAIWVELATMVGATIAQLEHTKTTKDKRNARNAEKIGTGWCCLKRIRPRHAQHYQMRNAQSGKLDWLCFEVLALLRILQNISDLFLFLLLPVQKHQIERRGELKDRHPLRHANVRVPNIIKQIMTMVAPIV